MNVKELSDIVRLMSEPYNDAYRHTADVEGDPYEWSLHTKLPIDVSNKECFLTTQVRRQFLQLCSLHNYRRLSLIKISKFINEEDVDWLGLFKHVIESTNNQIFILNGVIDFDKVDVSMINLDALRIAVVSELYGLQETLSHVLSVMCSLHNQGFLLGGDEYLIEACVEFDSIKPLMTEITSKINILNKR